LLILAQGVQRFDWRYATGGRFTTAQISARNFDRRELQSEIVPPSIDQANLLAEHPVPESAVDLKVEDPYLRNRTNDIWHRAEKSI
jgi:hypothetical protein